MFGKNIKNIFNNDDLQPQNLPEQVVWYLAIATYPLYLIGSLYIIVPLVGLIFTGYGLWQWRMQTSTTPFSSRVLISPSAWVWLAAGLIIEIAMLVGHFNFDLGIKLMAFSTINNWYRRWAIIPMFILLGQFLIRPRLIYRAACIIALETGGVIVVGTVLATLGMPEIDYISPLSAFGGGNDHYHIYLFQNALEERIYSFTPWYTATGTLGNFFFFLAREEKVKQWRYAGIISALIMVLVSQSRAALLCIPFVLTIVWLVQNIAYPRTQIISSVGCFILGIFSFQISKSVSWAQEQFNNFRGKDSLYSSRTRNILYRMTIKSWWEDAPIWGHGRVPEYGPRVVGNMPIGTHNTWLGALYTFGLVGFSAFAIATFFSLFNLLARTRQSHTARVGLCLFISLFVSSFTDSIEYITYVYWLALLFIGVALREQQEELELAQQPIDSPAWQLN
ncbi:MAG: O-antigen ligase family protein [Cyanobacteria bacterium J06623_7]